MASTVKTAIDNKNNTHKIFSSPFFIINFLRDSLNIHFKFLLGQKINMRVAPSVCLVIYESCYGLAYCFLERHMILPLFYPGRAYRIVDVLSADQINGDQRTFPEIINAYKLAGSDYVHLTMREVEQKISGCPVTFN